MHFAVFTEYACIIFPIVGKKGQNYLCWGRYPWNFKVNNYTRVSNIFNTTAICLPSDSAFFLLLYISNIHVLEKMYLAKVITEGNLKPQGHIYQPFHSFCVTHGFPSTEWVYNVRSSGQTSDCKLKYLEYQCSPICQYLQTIKDLTPYKPQVFIST